VVFGITTLRLPKVHAASTIIVNSKADNTADDGVCTLREAIIAANTDTASGISLGECVGGSGADTINFTLTGPADFINSYSGYTIAISSALPSIASSVTIDGYSQTYATPNTAVSPAPFNGKLLVQVNGASSPPLADCFKTENATGVLIRGLVISNCGGNGILIRDSNNVTIQGNYIGTDPTGLINQPAGHFNSSSVTGSGVMIISSLHTLVGGTAPAERNLISGNQFGELFIQSDYVGSDPSVPAESQYTTVQGNYFGLTADGLTAMPCGYAFGHGNSLLITHSAHDLIGGTAIGAGNVIASSSEYGISLRDGTYDTTIQGNYIGTDHTGNASPSHPLGTGHVADGISVGTVSGGGYHLASHDVLIGGAAPRAGNVIAGNTSAQSGFRPSGITIHDGGYNVTVQGNKIGVGADGFTPLGNQGSGVVVSTLGWVYVHDGIGNLIGGTATSEANIIANNQDAGILVNDDATRVAILGNSIHDNVGLGIDLGGGGLTQNDPLDSDIGPNDLINFPYYTDAVEAFGNTTVDYILDVPAGSYRIEFYKNTTADPSGNGEGQVYLGFQDVTSTGTGSQNHSYTLNGITGVTNLAMTATQIDSSTPSGFGPTSEFGGQVPGIYDIATSITLNNPQDVAPGAIIHYTLTFTNNGPDDVNIGRLDTSQNTGNALFLNIAPPDLTFLSGSGTNINCNSEGIGSASLIGPLLGNHADHELVNCGYTVPGTLLAAGQSVSAILNYRVTSGSSLRFTNYSVVGINDNIDPDYAVFSSALGGAQDFLDVLGNSINNIAFSAYPAPVIPPAPVTPPGSTSLSGGMQAVLGALPLTGAKSILTTIMFGIIIVSATVIIRRLRRRPHHRLRLK